MRSHIKPLLLTKLLVQTFNIRLLLFFGPLGLHVTLYPSITIIKYSCLALQTQLTRRADCIENKVVDDFPEDFLDPINIEVKISFDS